METQQSQVMPSKTKSRKIWIIALLLLMAIGGLWWWTAPHLPWTYSAEPIRGKVVDAGTGEPIHAAIVVAIWKLETPSWGFALEGSRSINHMHVAEVLTEDNGEFFIPAWGPKWRPWGSYMTNDSPMLVVFKENYKPFTEGNTWYWQSGTEGHRYSHRRVHFSEWNGKTIKLKRFEGDLKEYYDELRRLKSALGGSLFYAAIGEDNCDWQKIPQMMLIFDQYYQELSMSGFSHYLIPSIDEMVEPGKCGTKEEFIRENK